MTEPVKTSVGLLFIGFLGRRKTRRHPGCLGPMDQRRALVPPGFRPAGCASPLTGSGRWWRSAQCEFPSAGTERPAQSWTYGMSGDTHSFHCWWLMLAISLPHNKSGHARAAGIGHNRTVLSALAEACAAHPG